MSLSLGTETYSKIQNGHKMKSIKFLVLGLLLIAGLKGQAQNQNSKSELKQYNLLPMKDQRMFLPLNGTVRKEIGKKEGDFVQVVLYYDPSPVEIPDEILACLLDAPLAHQFFSSLSESNQKYYLDWIAGAKKIETKVARIQKAIERLENGLKFYDWVNEE